MKNEVRGKVTMDGWRFRSVPHQNSCLFLKELPFPTMYHLKRYKSLVSVHHAQAVHRFQNNHRTFNLSINNLSH